MSDKGADSLEKLRAICSKLKIATPFAVRVSGEWITLTPTKDHGDIKSIQRGIMAAQDNPSLLLSKRESDSEPDAI